MVDLNGGTFTQVGIVSAGSVNGCATEAPGIYTKVTGTQVSKVQGVRNIELVSIYSFLSRNRAMDKRKYSEWHGVYGEQKRPRR